MPPPPENGSNKSRKLRISPEFTSEFLKLLEALTEKRINQKDLEKTRKFCLILKNKNYQRIAGLPVAGLPGDGGALSGQQTELICFKKTHLNEIEMIKSRSPKNFEKIIKSDSQFVYSTGERWKEVTLPPKHKANLDLILTPLPKPPSIKDWAVKVFTPIPVFLQRYRESWFDNRKSFKLLGSISDAIFIDHLPLTLGRKMATKLSETFFNTTSSRG